MNEVVKAEKGEVFTEEDIKFLHEFDEIKKRYNVWFESKKDALDQFLAERGEDSYTQGDTTVYRVKPYKKKQIDTKKLKEEGLYDLYTRDVWVKGSIRVQINYDD